ncbi:unnamed protein product [Cochlearia groenlandica]
MSKNEEETVKTKLDSSCESSSDVDNGNCSSSSSGSGGDTKKTCVDCGTSRTPLWRGGPSGPKSLCNACGIKSRKKRQAALGITQEETKIKIKTKVDSENHKSSSNKKSVKRVSRFLDLGFKVPAMKRSAVEKKRLWRKLGEEEQAAVLLMTLSFG